MTKNLTPLYIVLAFISCLSTGCKFYRVASDKTLTNTPRIGIEWNYGDQVNEALAPRVDSVINLAIDTWNQQKHGFTVHQKEPKGKDKDYISIDINRVHKVRTGGKIAGYSISAIGLIGVPALLIATETPYIIAFFYWPGHSVEAKAELNGSLGADKRPRGPLGAGTGALFSKDSKQLNKMLTQFKERILKMLSIIEGQLETNGQNAGK